jgi:hypothetical protein
MELVLIHQKIQEIRGCKVMLDFDLSLMYDVENRALKQLLNEIIIDFRRILCFN